MIVVASDMSDMSSGHEFLKIIDADMRDMPSGHEFLMIIDADMRDMPICAICRVGVVRSWNWCNAGWSPSRR